METSDRYSETSGNPALDGKNLIGHDYSDTVRCHFERGYDGRRPCWRPLGAVLGVDSTDMPGSGHPHHTSEASGCGNRAHPRDFGWTFDDLAVDPLRGVGAMHVHSQGCVLLPLPRGIFCT